MAMYICFNCGDYVDNDRHPCEEHPNRDGELVCPSCRERFKETPQVRQKGIFTKKQLEQIKKMEEGSYLKSFLESEANEHYDG